MAENQQLQVGDVVILNSGGPEMTINYFTNSGTYRCAWFDGKELKEGGFTLEALKKIG